MCFHLNPAPLYDKAIRRASPAGKRSTGYASLINAVYIYYIEEHFKHNYSIVEVQ